MRFLPVSLLDDAPAAVFITDESGRIEYLNRAAVRVLGCDADAVRGKPCRVAGFRLLFPDGHPFCSARSCPIQRMLLRGRPPEQPLDVVLVRSGGARAAARLESFAVSPPGGGGVAILHRLVVPAAARNSDPPAVFLRAAQARLSKLSRRESEILEQLSRGMQTDEIAADLFISHETVRNHIRHILDKLGLHHRIDAVVAWVAARGHEGESNPGAADPDGSSWHEVVPLKE